MPAAPTLYLPCACSCELYLGEGGGESGDQEFPFVQVSKDAYDKRVAASPIERLKVEPDERPELTEGKCERVNACPCMRDALGRPRPQPDFFCLGGKVCFQMLLVSFRRIELSSTQQRRMRTSVKNTVTNHFGRKAAECAPPAAHGSNRGFRGRHR